MVRAPQGDSPFLRYLSYIIKADITVPFERAPGKTDDQRGSTTADARRYQEPGEVSD
jgi:hypothetical protein